MKRQIGGRLWELNKSVVIFIDDKYVGDDTDFMKYIIQFYKFGVVKDFYVQGQNHLMKIIDNNQKLGVSLFGELVLFSNDPFRENTCT